MIRRVFLTIFALFIFVGTALSQINFEARLPRVVNVGEPFRIEFNANQKVEDFQAPSFEGFNVIAGPSTSQGTSVEFVNGKMTKSVNVSYTYVLLAEKSGTFTVGSATATYKKKSYKTSPTAVEVVASNGASAQSGGATSQGSQAAQNTQNASQNELLLRTEVNKKDVYKGEPISVEVKLYYRAELSNLTSFKAASFNGFWKYDFPAQQYQPQRVNYRGKVYDAITISRYLVYPQKSGKLTIEPMTLGVAMSVPISNGASSSGSLFDNFFGSMNSYTTVEKSVASPKVDIEVKPLPNGAPASFDGAVGNFKIESKLSTTSLSANSSATLTLTIKGDGNLPLLVAPNIDFPTSFELYPSKTIDNFKENTKTVSGSKVFEYPFIVRSEGEYKLAPLEFTYFDISSKSYKTLKGKAFDVEVLKDTTANSGLTAPLITPIGKEELKILGKDINYIMTGEPKPTTIGKFVVTSWWYWAILLLIVGLFAAAFSFMKQLIRELSDKAKMKNKKANKVALQRLKEAKKAMIGADKQLFYEQLLKALNGYLSDKLNIDASLLSKENISQKLIEKGVDNSDIEALCDTLSDCELARYAPSGVTDPESLYNSTVELIGKIETGVRR